MSGTAISDSGLLGLGQQRGTLLQHNTKSNTPHIYSGY